MIDSQPAATTPADDVVRIRGCELHVRQKTLWRDGEPVALTPREMDLLLALARNAHRWAPAEMLLRAVWGAGEATPNNLRVHLSHLRRQIGADAIEHRTGFGWRLRVDGVADPIAHAAADDHGAASPAERPPAAISPGPAESGHTQMVGRAAELRALHAELLSHQRVTLVGTAGVGKTTLGRAVGEQLRDVHRDGACFVALAALSEGGQVLGAVAAALGLTLPADARMDYLVRALAPRRMLLVLDNCEHVVGAVGALADALLRGAPDVALLATSRQPLKVAGERLHALAPLPLPEGTDLAAARASPAVVLFEQRARSADPRFTLTDENVAGVAKLCHQLDGLPLALLLAASRLPLLGVAGLVAALGEHVGDGLRLLSRRDGSGPERHASLEAALDFSHALLSAQEQVVLRRLGAFSGSFALDAVQAICADEAIDRWAVLEAVDGLIRHSLLATDADALLTDHSPQRYTMHQSIRAYARARLEAADDAAAVGLRHALHYTQVAEGPLSGPGPHRQLVAAPLADADHDNVRRALEWSYGSDRPLTMRLVGALGYYWRLRGHHGEALRWTARLLQEPACAGAEHLPMRNKMRMQVCGSAFEGGNFALLRDYAERSLAEYRDAGNASGMSQALFWLATAQHCLGDVHAGIATYHASVEQARAGGDDIGVAHAYLNLGRVSIDLGDHAQAEAWLQQGLQLYRRLDAPLGETYSHHHLGDVAFARQDDKAAEAEWRIALQGYREMGYHWPTAALMAQLGCLLARQGLGNEGRRSVTESLAMSRQHAFEDMQARGLAALAAVGLAEAEHSPAPEERRAAAHTAARLLGAADMIQRRLGLRTHGVPRLVEAGALERAQAALSPESWQVAWSQGAQWTPAHLDALIRG